MNKTEILEAASTTITWEAAYTCYPDDIEEYYKEGMTARQLADVVIKELRKSGWFDQK